MPFCLLHLVFHKVVLPRRSLGLAKGVIVLVLLLPLYVLVLRLLRLVVVDPRLVRLLRHPVKLMPLDRDAIVPIPDRSGRLLRGLLDPWPVLSHERMVEVDLLARPPPLHVRVDLRAVFIENALDAQRVVQPLLSILCILTLKSVFLLNFVLRLREDLRY